MIERERARVFSHTMGNALLGSALVIFIAGAMAIALVLRDRAGIFAPVGVDLGFTDYLRIGLGYSLTLATVTAILVSAGLYFRWLAFEQDARMAEFDLLLDVIEGIEPDDGGPDNTPDADANTP